MFTGLIRRVIDRTRVLENFLHLCAACDDAIARPETELSRELAARAALASDLTAERVFRHCAVVTQLYSIYEWFAEAVLGFWLARLPRYQNFSDLPEPFRNAYRYGMVQVIQNIDKRRYRHLSLAVVLETYLRSVRGLGPWEFVNDALTVHDANLRRGELEKMFNSAGLENVWRSLEDNAQIIRHTTESDSNKSLEQTLLDLVNFRNDASHGYPDEILGLDTLSEWIAFVGAFCNALADVLTHRVVTIEAKHRPDSIVGVVTETFRDNRAVVTCDRGLLAVGNRVYFLRERDCTEATIESLQLDDIDQAEVHIDQPGLEVGIRTSSPIRRKSQLIRIEEPQ